MTYCPCGSQLAYTSCCGLYIDGQQSAPSPEALMRSRYTAYSLAQVNYIKNTMRDKPLIGFDEVAAKRWAEKVNWIDLRVVNSTIDNPNLGHVEFIVRFIEGDKLKTIHETSEFHRENDSWFYVDGVLQPTSHKMVSRNSPCPCGSHKKFKNCHGQSY